jgi:hypothetical protein
MTSKCVLAASFSNVCSSFSSEDMTELLDAAKTKKKKNEQF